VQLATEGGLFTEKSGQALGIAEALRFVNFPPQIAQSLLLPTPLELAQRLPKFPRLGGNIVF
jgi:hypothetical protein